MFCADVLAVARGAFFVDDGLWGIVGLGGRLVIVVLLFFRGPVFVTYLEDVYRAE